ncbi:MAG: serine/threonine protein kinase [Betaproteobacteria bacterium]
MSLDDEDDRTVIRPSGGTAGLPHTQRPAGPAAPPQGDDDRTRIGAGSGTPQGAAPAGPAPDDDNTGLPVGTRLGEFEITGLVGEGGFGLVYSAHDHSLQRRVAVKEYMPGSLASRGGGSRVQVKSERHRETFEAGLKSFINEARLLASFDHPSLVKVYRFWEANGTAYMVMPFLDGTTLRDVLRRMPAPPDEAWLRSVLGPLTEALLVIHAEQCYHRDIAPDNVMLLGNRWLLLDFGAARRVIGDMTQALTVILKPGYAPVEQYAEIPGMKQGPWTDVYALAAVIYFAIMGRTPPPSVGRMLKDTYVPLVQAAAGRYSERFLAAVDRALAVRPEERTQSIGELRQDLGLGAATLDPYATVPMPPGALPGAEAAPAPAPAAPPPPPAGASHRAPDQPTARSGNRTLIGAGIGVGVLVALAGAAYVALAPAPSPPPAVAEVSAVAPVAQPAPSPAVTPAATPAAPQAFDPAAEFARVVQAQAAGFDVRLQTNRASYRIDRDELSFTIQSAREGFVYAFVHGASGELLQLYPNTESGAIKVRPGQTLRLPQSPIVLNTAGPPGPTDLLVMVSPRQRDHAAMRPRSEAAFRSFPTGPEAAQSQVTLTPMDGRAV